MMYLGAGVVVLGLIVLLADYGAPIPSLTAHVPGVSVAGESLPPGLVILLIGILIAGLFGWLSNERYRAGKRRRR